MRVVLVYSVRVWQQKILDGDVEAEIRLNVDDGVSHGRELKNSEENGHTTPH